MTKVRIVAAVVDTRRLTLYKEDGDTIRIPQGDPRIQGIIDQSHEPLSRGSTVEIDLSEADQTTTYNDFEKKTNGMVRFFKVAKSKIASIFGTQANENDTAPAVPEMAVGNQDVLKTALADIMAHAVPAADDNLGNDDTVVAVIDNQPIPGAENLLKQFAHATAVGSTKGMEVFMSRIAKVIGARRHSVDDLLKFMQKGDLPVAEDGSIIIYKILRRHPDGGYVDCYSGNVRQDLGSYVRMDPAMVDHDRRRECSNGLHVARRGYLNCFGGDVCVLAKVAPEDVIAVPEKDPNKMRVCGYHILFELTDEMFKTLKADQPMTSIESGKLLLGRAIAGDHELPTEDVIIGGSMGSNVTVNPKLTNRTATAPKPAVSVELAQAIDISDPTKITAPAVDPKAVNKKVVAAKTAPKPLTPASSKKDEARYLFATGSWDKLLAFKKAAKKGWAVLGFSPSEIEVILEKAK